jgi:hypothetical protein
VPVIFVPLIAIPLIGHSALRFDIYGAQFLNPVIVCLGRHPDEFNYTDFKLPKEAIDLSPSVKGLMNGECQQGPKRNSSNGKGASSEKHCNCGLSGFASGLLMNWEKENFGCMHIRRRMGNHIDIFLGLSMGVIILLLF